MRSWTKFIITNKPIKNTDDKYLSTSYQLIDNNKNFKNIFNFKFFKKNEIFFKQYCFLKKNLNPIKKTLFIGSSWGETEFFLKDKFNIVASDIDDEYIKFHKKNTSLDFVKLNILDLKNHKYIYEQIVVNNIEYLFDNQELKKSIKNILKITKPGAKIFVIFRSRDSLLIKIIEILTFIETGLIYFIKKFYLKDIHFIKLNHGFRRNLKEFKKIWIQNNFEFVEIYEDLFKTEYERLRIFKKLGISNLLFKIFNKQNSYLNILEFRNKSGINK
jgi:hypothetical protein